MAAVNGGVRWLLRLEGLVVLVFAAFLYGQLGFEWKWFLLLFLVPDLSFLGYLVSSLVGALSYNFFHTYATAIVCCAVGFMLPNHWLMTVGLIWVAHVGFDRALGYGLKYKAGFTQTHLGVIGRHKG